MMYVAINIFLKSFCFIQLRLMTFRMELKSGVKKDNNTEKSFSTIGYAIIGKYHRVVPKIFPKLVPKIILITDLRLSLKLS